MTHSTACLFSTLNRWILHDCQMRGCWICFGIFAFGFGQIESILFFYSQLWPKYNFQTRFSLFRCSMALSVKIWMLSLTKYATGVSLWENWQMCETNIFPFPNNEICRFMLLFRWAYYCCLPLGYYVCEFNQQNQSIVMQHL